MEFPKNSLENTQQNFFNESNAPLPESTWTNRNLYFSPIEQNISYQNSLSKILSPNQSFISPNYYRYNEVGFGQRFPEANYSDIGRLEKESDISANKTSNTEIQEKDNSENVLKKTAKHFTKHKLGNDSSNKLENNWQDHEIDALIQYISDNFEDYRRGKKVKLFNEISTNVLKNKESNAIKCKLARMLKTYSDVKKHNEKSGVERKDWKWFEKMDSLFGTRENISPSFIANRSTIGIEESEEGSGGGEPKYSKKLKKNNVDTIAVAISAMSESRERVWDKKIELEREKMEKQHVLEMNRLEIERERLKMEHEQKMKEIEIRQLNNSNNSN